MVDPRTPQEQPAAPRAGGVRTGVAAFVAATALIAGGAAWPAFFGNDAPARATVQAAGPALLNTGPVATSYADLDALVQRYTTPAATTGNKFYRIATSQ